MSMIDFYNALVGYFNLIQQYIISPSAILIKQSRDLIFRRTNLMLCKRKSFERWGGGESPCPSLLPLILILS